ncbi:MAG: VCBS repeat-containing protein, partial [Planctomycetaceae bacterium]
MRNQWIAGVVGTSALVAVVGLAADPVVTLTSGPLRFEERLLMKGFTYSFGVAAGDIDGDGDLDLTAADALPNNSVYLFTNDGNRGFQRSLIQKNDPQRLERHQLGDIDGDGRLDLVIVKNLYGDVLWFRNDGSPRASLWKRHAILSKKLKGAYDVALADFDRDGDLDVAASSWRLSNNYVWFENDGSPADGEWTMRIIDEKVNETRMIRQADIDGDKDPDLVCTARRAPLVVWYENTGNPRAGWKKHVIDEKTVQPIHGMPVDMDRDGDVDVLLACGMTFSGSPASEQIVWYENAGGGRNWKRHTVARSFHGA